MIVDEVIGKYDPFAWLDEPPVPIDPLPISDEVPLLLGREPFTAVLLEAVDERKTSRVSTVDGDEIPLDVGSSDISGISRYAKFDAPEMLQSVHNNRNQ